MDEMPPIARDEKPVWIPRRMSKAQVLSRAVAAEILVKSAGIRVKQARCFVKTIHTNGYAHGYARTQPKKLEIPAEPPYLVGVYDAHSSGLFSLLADSNSGDIEMKNWGAFY